MRSVFPMLLGMGLGAWITSHASAVSITYEGEFGHEYLRNGAQWLALDSQRQLLVGELFAYSGTPNSDVVVFDSAHALVGTYGASFLNFGADLVVAPNGHTYILQTPNVLDLDATYAPVGTFGKHGFGGGIAADAASNIYITDATTSAVYKYSPAGELLLTIAPAAPDDLRYPNAVVVAPDGTIIVADTFHNCIKTFDAGGQYLATINTTVAGITGGHVRDIALASDGTIYALLDGSGNPNFSDRAIGAFSPDGTFLGAYNSSATLYGLILDGTTLYATDTEHARILVFSVPEPASLALCALPLAALLSRRRR